MEFKEFKLLRALACACLFPVLAILLLEKISEKLDKLSDGHQYTYLTFGLDAIAEKTLNYVYKQLYKFL